MKNQRCTIQLLDATDLERAVDNPALAGLIGEGWTVISNLVVDTPQGNRIALIMAPPHRVDSRKIVAAIIAAVALQSLCLAWILS